jgi:branched-chain amino acid transport system substrate-binding protein
LNEIAKKKKLLPAFLCVILAFTLAACSDKETNNSRDIYIPILADEAWLTSDGAFMGGVQLAVDDLNAEYSGKGFKIRAGVVDDKDQYEKGVEMATKVAEDNTVTAVLNLQNFDVSKTTSGILSENGKPVIFPYGAYDSLFTRDNPYLFCGVPAFSDLGGAMADYAVKSGYKRIAIYHNGTQAQEELSSAFELTLLNSGSRVVDYIPSIPSENDFDGIYSRWKALDVDCVVISQYGLDRAFEVLKLLRSRDKEIAVIGEPVFNAESSLTENREIAEGMAVPSTMILAESKKLDDFKSRYSLKYGKEPDIWAVQGYDMVRLVADTAVKLDTNDPVKISQALHDEKGYKGIGRHIAFTNGGAMIADAKKLPVLICRDGRFE